MKKCLLTYLRNANKINEISPQTNEDGIFQKYWKYPVLPEKEKGPFFHQEGEKLTGLASMENNIEN